MTRKTVVGLISDTHGLLRPEALERLAGSNFIVHAGDIGKPEILAALGRVAPVTAVRGNVDTGAWARSLPETALLKAGERALIHVLHRIEDLAIDPLAAGVGAVVFGHSHKPGFYWKNGVLYVNPGSAGPRRFSLPITIGRLMIEGDRIEEEIIVINHA